MGAEADLRWLTPLPLWVGILAGPAAWASDLCISYALVHWTCASQRAAVLRGLTPAALAVVGVGAVISFVSLRRTPPEAPTDGGNPIERARFMAILGLVSSALFAVAIVAGAIPRWVLDACQ